jgi:hypothetical protein
MTKCINLSKLAVIQILPEKGANFVIKHSWSIMIPRDTFSKKEVTLVVVWIRLIYQKDIAELAYFKQGMQKTD